jgi:hypothetical protein
MIHTKDNFFNSLASDIRETYFKEVKFYRDNENCTAAIYSIELFNNGCLTYRQLIVRLAKACKDRNINIHAIVEKQILSFGSYKYSPKKTWK